MKVNNTGQANKWNITYSILECCRTHPFATSNCIIPSFEHRNSPFCNYFFQRIFLRQTQSVSAGLRTQNRQNPQSQKLIHYTCVRRRKQFNSGDIVSSTSLSLVAVVCRRRRRRGRGRRARPCSSIKTSRPNDRSLSQCAVVNGDHRTTTKLPIPPKRTLAGIHVSRPHTGGFNRIRSVAVEDSAIGSTGLPAPVCQCASAKH